MPHVDLTAVEDASILKCDLCIIGTGPAGCTIARELSGTKLRVTMIESGDFERQEQVDALNEIENIGRSRVMDQWLVRNRILGGSSYTWGGRCAPFDEIDYERRAWIPYSGWPFGADHMIPYLDRSANYLGLGVGSGYSDERFWKLAGRTSPVKQLDPGLLLPFFWQGSQDDGPRRDSMRFGKHLLRYLGENVTLVTNATVLEIKTNEAGAAVTSVEVASPDGKRRRIAASAIVVCAGGIENARLLLCSEDLRAVHQHDVVGRFLMDHLRDTVGAFQGLSRPLQKRYGLYKVATAAGERLFRHGLRLSPEIQREEELVNCSAFLQAVISPDDPWDALKRVLRNEGERGKDLAIVAGKLGHLLGAARTYLAGEGLPQKLERLELVCMCEQVPDPESRVMLSDKRDRFGMRLSKIDWRVHETEVRTLRRMAGLIALVMGRIGEEVPVLDEWVRDGGPLPPGAFLDVAHPTGTTRMSDNPREGVVDQNCEAHGVRGLYVAGSSVFPTGSHCNPTQMIVAMALRLSDRLRLSL